MDEKFIGSVAPFAMNAIPAIAVRRSTASNLATRQVGQKNHSNLPESEQDYAEKDDYEQGSSSQQVCWTGVPRGDAG